MASRTILADPGPLVAFIAARDEWHDWAVHQFQSLSPPWFTCEAVVSEALHLLEAHPDGVSRLTLMLERGALQLRFSLDDHLPAILALVRRYSDTPMSLADACLVRMSELDDSAAVFTTDGDFRIYRKNSWQVIPLIYPHERQG
jgi:uncharacterized protein